MELVPYNKYVKGKDRPANYIYYRGERGTAMFFTNSIYLEDIEFPYFAYIVHSIAVCFMSPPLQWFDCEVYAQIDEVYPGFTDCYPFPFHIH